MRIALAALRHRGHHPLQGATDRAMMVDGLGGAAISGFALRGGHG